MSNEIAFSYRELEKKNSLYQTFFIIGLDSDDIFSDVFYENIKSNALTPKIISKFPNFFQSFNNLPDELIIQHCFPFGFSSQKLNPNKTDDETFYFTLDNHPLNYIEGCQFSKIYYTCQIIHEKISSISNIREKYAKMKKEEITPMPNELDDYCIPKALCLASLLPFPKESFKILLGLKSCIDNEITVPIEKILENLIFGVPLLPRGKFEVDFNISHPQIAIKFSQSPLNQIPINSSVLNILFNTLKSEEILDIFKCFLLEIPIIFFSESLSKLTSFIEGAISLIYPFQYKYPAISILPLSCYSAIEEFPCFIFGINKKFNDSFFEDNNLDISDKTVIAVDLDKQRLISKKPSFNQNPYLYLSHPIKSESSINTNLFETLNFPATNKKKILNALVSYISKVRSKGNNMVGKEEFNKEIRGQFFNFILSLLSDYSKFLKLSHSNLNEFEEKYISKKKNCVTIDDLFDLNGFLDNNKSADMLFYKKFLSTKLFLDFVIRKVYPKNNIEKLENIFIDEKLIAKKGRSFFSSNIETPFINSEEELCHYEVFQAKIVKNFSQDEYIEIIKEDNIKKAITYYQYFSVEEIEDELQSQVKNIRINYPIFPKLLYDNHFFQTDYESFCISNQRKTENLIEKAEKEYISYLSNGKYTHIYNGSLYKLNFYEIYHKKSVKMETYVKLTWLFVLSGTLWYCDKEERDQRIAQLFDIIETIEYIEEDIFEYIFLSLIKYGTDAHAIKMYEYMLLYEELNTYTSYALLCMKMSKQFSTPEEINNKQLLQEETSINDEKIFRKRKLFISNSNSGNKAEFVKFESMYKCETCYTEYEIDFNKILTLNKGNLNLPCPNCNVNLEISILKLRVMLGANEEFKIDTFSLVNPDELCEISLKMFIKNANYKIDVEHLRMNYSKLFYNYLFYFALCNLPFDFIIPYEKEKIERVDNQNILREFSNLNIDSKTTMGEVISKSMQLNVQKENVKSTVTEERFAIQENDKE